MSLLIERGHYEARSYPIGMVLDEEQIAVERINHQTAMEAILIQMAASSIMSKKAGEEFNKMVKRLMPDG